MEGTEALAAIVAAREALDACIPKGKGKLTDIAEADKNEIRETIEEGEAEAEETCSQDACVICSRAPEGAPHVHIEKEKGGVEVNGRRELTKTDIKLEECFAGCTAETAVNGQCSVTEEDIEGGVWQNVDEDRSEDGAETLKQESSYMICMKGFGLICFVDSGQEVRSAWDTLERYVNEDIVKKIDEEWDFEVFYDKYGADAFEQLRLFMLEYGVTDPVSVMMFLCRLPIECGHGTEQKENNTNEFFHAHGYDETTCGAGLMQLTGETQSWFFTYIINNKDLEKAEKDILTDLKDKFKLIKIGNEEYWIIENKNKNENKNSTEHIIDHYPIESAVWFWACCTKVTIAGIGSESINDFIVRHKEDNLYNTFACSQMFVNGKPYVDESVYDEISECPVNCQIDVVSNCPEPTEAYEHKKHEYCFYLGARNRHAYGPNGWGVRGSCWEKAEEILRENGDI